jgi:lipid II:glycine glycyltransferase (peptidoglycan interpeptide bridge formation enzyme)
LNNFKYIARKDINIKKWNDLAMRTDGAMVYSLSWYLDEVSESWGAYVWGDYKAAFPIPVATKKLNVKVVYQPFFSRTLTFLGEFHDDKSNFLNQLAFDYKLIHFCSDISFSLPTSKWKVEEFPFQVLDLEGGIEKLALAYSTNAKRQIKKARENQFSVVETDDFQLISDSFHRINQSKVKDLTPDHVQRLNNLFARANQEGVGKAFVVKSKEGSVLAGAYFLFFKDRITYLKGFLEEDAKNSGAMFFLFDRIFADYAHGYRVFDFGGSKVKSIASFFKKFGAKDAYYFSYSYNNLSVPVNLLRKIMKR